MKTHESSKFYRFFKRYFITGLNGMALALFCTLILGLIIKQISINMTGDIRCFFLAVATVAMSLTGPMIGIGVAHALEEPKLVILASGATGFIGAFGAAFAHGKLIEGGKIIVSGAGDPLGAFIAVVIGAEIGRLVSGKTKLDIIITPFVTVMTGAATAYIAGPYLLSGMHALGKFIQTATMLQPFVMGIVVSVVMGMALTLPISSAALSIILGLSGLASGAATAGCSAQMVGFAVISFKANRWNGLLAQGIGTSMLQVPNIMKKPVIWLPPIVASAILGPISTMVFKMENNPAGGGMGTSGLVGQLMTWQTMAGTRDHTVLFIEIVLLHFILPAVLSLLVAGVMKKKGIIKDEDYLLIK
ncbi:PTS transporter subunit IIC [Fusobacterium sp.]|uniref:PTS transporter subunit IIC n=1 Tax=Fusobacterium sp. TaxID=68766 RepID=UPI00396C95E9